MAGPAGGQLVALRYRAVVIYVARDARHVERSPALITVAGRTLRSGTNRQGRIAAFVSIAIGNGGAMACTAC
jgi:hypothetical protein